MPTAHKRKTVLENTFGTEEYKQKQEKKARKKIPEDKRSKKWILEHTEGTHEYKCKRARLKEKAKRKLEKAAASARYKIRHAVRLRFEAAYPEIYAELKARRDALPVKDRTKTYQHYPHSKYNAYKAGATDRDYAFDLTEAEFMSFWKAPCHYCGDPINPIGLDRVTNSIGYTMDNVVPCCTQCNRMKLYYSIDEFMDKISKIYHKRQETLND